MPPDRGPRRGLAPNGVGLRVARCLAAGVWLVYLVIPLPPVFGHGHSALYSIGAIVLTAVFTVIYLALIVSWEGPPRRTETMFGALFAIAVAGSVIYGAAGITMWIFVAAAAGWAIGDRRRALRALGVVAACYVGLGLSSHLSTSNFLLNLLPLVLVGGMVIGFRRRIELARELSMAREEVVRLAASEERLRLARDMHDLTGQSLSTITLKSELAARLLARLPEGPERDRAKDEIEQVAAVSRQTLRDIRQAISGYRRPTLAVEIITARNALESAGIVSHDDADLTLASGTFDPDAEAALAWCLREAVTNVIRHSGARNCHIGLTRRFGSVSIKVRDDGRGYQAAGDRPDGRPDVVTGAGLRGMSERLSAVGGQLELRPGSEGFVLIATVPAKPGPATEVSAEDAPATDAPARGVPGEPVRPGTNVQL
jgi:two-component system sensor histidine kinase DesK